MNNVVQVSGVLVSSQVSQH